ncbi:glycosyl transferase-like protein [Oceaniovalibus guishaninsula JLT2003]|uniref:Glycosyl transferase-like protein n=1 Tax=Oceaniovalibus guishaninsula JLT2003 TaxID=1231392 RepID=K2HK88_9RHOB|nr:glycosyltransferase [Oceaniovalibus guishaninsula]EKE43379.1 glycosyl transferase-like protein [Oceaniovalibus guishaninsula JLT2003]
MIRPEISVLMPVASARYLGPALDSLLSQTLTTFELVLVDDARDDETRDAIDRAAAADNRIRIVRAAAPGGLAALLNEGLDACRAPLVARADADDIYHRERLARQAQAIVGRPGLLALSCGYWRIAADGKRLWRLRPETDAARLRFRTLIGCPLLHPGAMFRRDAVMALGGYDTALWTAQDNDLWARLAQVGDLGNLPEPLVEWREHGGTVSAARGPQGIAVSNGVSQRHLAAYLGTAPAIEDVAAARALWRREAAPRPPAEIDRGDRFLRRLLRAARSRESRDVRRHFARHVAGAYLNQARWLVRTHRAEAARMASRAAAWMARP